MYTPTNLPAAGGGLDYFGASPYQRGMLFAVTTDLTPAPVPYVIPLPPPPPFAAPAGWGRGPASSSGQAGA
jgi:hypothetical protein